MKKIKFILASTLFSLFFLASNNHLYAQKCTPANKKKCTVNNKVACGPNNTKTHKASVIQELEKSYVGLMKLIHEKYPDYSKNNIPAYTTSENEKLVIANIDKGLKGSKSLFKNIALKEIQNTENKAQKVKILQDNISNLMAMVDTGK